MSKTVFLILILVIVSALFFALTNGLQDASSVVATLIASGAASPLQAVTLASIFGLVGAVFGGSEVVNTISGIVDLPMQPPLLTVLLAALLGATSWNLITWKFGLPSSSTHSLIGGLIGAVIISSGPKHLLWGFSELSGPSRELVGIAKILIFLAISPFVGFFLAYFLEKLTKVILKNAKSSVNKKLKLLQWLMSASLSFNNGANDTQKIIGIIVLALASARGENLAAVPLWSRIASGTVLFTGTMLGGWSIMKTVGRGIYKLKPLDCFNSQLASSASILGANLIGAPVSSTQVVVGSVMGVGAADRVKFVHWTMVKEIIVSWAITIPISAGISGLFYTVFSFLGLA